MAAVEALLNRGIAGSMNATALARRLEGTALQVDIEGITAMRVAAAGARLALVGAVAAPAGELAPGVDAGISGSALALVRLARGSGGARGGDTAQIRGDAEIANSYRKLLALARPDWEEELSRLVGDLPARRLSQLAHRTFSWMTQVRRTAGLNIAEYLQEEGRDLVNRTELDEFLQGVDTLREATDRVEARLARLEQRLRESA